MIFQWRNEDWNEVEDILVVIDDYESASGKAVWVILALIIDRSCDPYTAALSKIAWRQPPLIMMLEISYFSPGKPVVIRSFWWICKMVPALITTDRTMGGDMWDDLHPFETGYAKMADLWFSGLMDILPQADAGDTQTVTEAATVTLDGSNSSDPNGTIGSYLWEQLPGGSLVHAFRCCHGHSHLHRAGCCCGRRDPDFPVDGHRQRRSGIQ